MRSCQQLKERNLTFCPFPVNLIKLLLYMQQNINPKLIALALCLVSCFSIHAQIPTAAFSFSCTKDTIVCNRNCISITTTIPDIRGTDSYKVKRLDCFTQSVSPAAPGTSLAFGEDDKYSGVLTLPFDFPFYDSVYNSLVVSTNGVISFDLNNAGAFSPWQITSAGVPQDLPNDFYERAVIMGVFHDIDIQNPTTSADRQIKYDVTGVAPHRKWVLSFYKIPCYSNACWNKINNTYQVTLYEGLGLVEVNVWGREICTTWNQGRAMMGMQNYDMDNGIMAPGREASAEPVWGEPVMNEAWRFIPSAGSSLLKRVQLYTLSGQLVTEGNTLSLGDGNYKVNFNNVCADSSSSYVVKSIYKKFDDPLIEMYATDTIQVIKSVPFVWTGSISAEWENPLNWSCNTLPGNTSNVFINGGNVQLNSNVTVNSITVQPGAAVTVAPGYHLTLLSQAGEH
jgi:hypothetical protein